MQKSEFCLRTGYREQLTCYDEQGTAVRVIFAACESNATLTAVAFVVRTLSMVPEDAAAR